MIFRPSNLNRNRAWWTAIIWAVSPLVFGGCSTPAFAQSEKVRQTEARYRAEILPILKSHCWDCHTGDSAEGGLQLDRYTNVATMNQHRDRWQKILKMIEAGAMPPPDSDQPSGAERRKLVDWIDRTLFYVDCSQAPDPGRVTVRRLNRVEYNNTIRDLMGVTIRPADDFPSDDVGEGFDNIGDVLSLPPLLFEKYMDAAERIAEEAVTTANPNGRITIGADRMMGRGSAKSGGGLVAIVSRGTAIARFDVPVSGSYRLIIRASADLAGDELPVMEVVAGRAKRSFRVDKARPGSAEYAMDVGALEGLFEVQASFVNDFYNPQGPPANRDRNLFIHEMTLHGPSSIIGTPKTGLQREIRKRKPKDPKDRQQVADAARPILNSIASRAFRRPARPEELERIVALVQLAVVQRGESFERGMQVGISAILVSPHFLFRIERHSDPDDPNQKQSVGNFELASRLSYFLWSTMPDHELFSLAREEKLHEPEVLRAQIKRMLADPKSESLVDNFAGQWLNLRNLDDLVPAAKQFPDFDDELREAMKEETYSLFRSLIREDRPVTDFLDANYTFVNERLARLYGIPGVRGKSFRRVRLPANRMGVSTHASILALTSNPTRTSPVKRGKWILENLLGSPPPEPPANVPDLDVTKGKNPDATLREQLEIHRQDPNCAVCHKEMDPIGLALENFDAIGRWRDRYDNGRIDARGTLPSGESFDGSREMLRTLAKRKQEFCRCLAEKLLTYALGRGLEYYDQCIVDDATKHVVASEYRFAALVEGIVLSDAFLKRRGETPTE